MYRWKFWQEILHISRVMLEKANRFSNYGPPCTYVTDTHMRQRVTSRQKCHRHHGRLLMMHVFRCQMTGSRQEWHSEVWQSWRHYQQQSCEKVQNQRLLVGGQLLQSHCHDFVGWQRMTVSMWHCRRGLSHVSPGHSLTARNHHHHRPSVDHSQQHDWVMTDWVLVMTRCCLQTTET